MPFIKKYMHPVMMVLLCWVSKFSLLLSGILSILILFMFWCACMCSRLVANAVNLFCCVQ